MLLHRLFYIKLYYLVIDNNLFMAIINSMIKKLLITFLSIFILFINTAKAQEVLKINNINFDNSDAIIFLGTSGLSNSTPLSIEKGKLSNPDRIYFDIQNAIVTKHNNCFEFKNSILTQLKLAQFSISPPVVRIVISYDNSVNPEQIKILKHNNNLIIKLKNTTPTQDYLTQVYREFKESPYDYYEKTSVTEETPPVQTPIPAPRPTAVQKTAIHPKNDIYNQVQQAFSETTDQITPQIAKTPAKAAVKTEQPVRKNPPLKESKLKSRYYIERIDIRKGNVLLSGVGVVNIEKLIYLSEPSRVIFDMPNTIVDQELRGKEFKISETESIKIGQFEPNKARAVITTPTPEKYRPIYAFDLQNVLIAHDDRMSGVKLFNSTSDITSFSIRALNESIDYFTIDFTSPIVQSIKRDNSKIELNLYNAAGYDCEEFKNVIRNTKLYASRVDRLPYQGVRITIPIKKETLVDCYENLNATQLKLTITTPKTEPVCTPAKPRSQVTAISQGLSGRIVFLDPGHGGSDTGALRAGIAEKDINLAIAKKVAAILTMRGAHVEMTRWSDATVSLQERVEFSNSKRTDIFVSIHINSSVRPEVHGIETHYYTDSGYEVAKVLHKSIMSKVSGIDRGLFKSRFYVINHTEAPSVLLELGFISNDKERNALLTEDRKQRSAEAIAEGIINYLNTQQKR